MKLPIQHCCIITYTIISFTGTFDFYGLNFYSSSMVTPADGSWLDATGNYYNDVDVNSWADPEWLG